MPRTAAKSSVQKRRLATARQVLQDAEVSALRGRVDELEAKFAASLSPAKLTADDGTVEAVVLFGTWMHDQATEETGPGIACRVGSALPVVALIEHDEGDCAGPDVAPGDHVRLRKISSRRYALIEVVKRAAKRRPCNWVGAWRDAALPSLAAVGLSAL